MTDRLRKIALYFNLSPAAFADLVGVSRPVISHIFSERNKPSLEVVQKIGAAFPELSPEWLLFGNGEMLKSVAEKLAEVPLPVKPENPALEDRIETPETSVGQNSPIESAPGIERLIQKSDPGKIIRIVFFYADNTFSEFKPS